MPMAFLGCFIFCLSIGAKFYAGTCFFLAVLFWIVLFAERYADNSTDTNSNEFE